MFAAGSKSEKRDNLKHMCYGICPNLEHCCEFSYRSKQFAQLHDLLHVIQARESQGKPAGDVTTLRWFTRYFQTGNNCRQCGEVLFCILKPVSGLDANSPEYESVVRLNHLLALVGDLQAYGILET